MTDKIIFLKDGAEIELKVKKSATRTIVAKIVVPYSVFNKNHNLKWKVKAIKPLTKKGVLLGIEADIENLDTDPPHNSRESRLKASSPHR